MTLGNHLTLAAAVGLQAPGSVCAQLQPGDGRYAVQKQITNLQSNRNEKELQRQVDLQTLQVRLQLVGAIPGAGETVQVPVTGTALDSKGNAVTVSGTISVTFQGGSTPTPIPPIGTTLEAVRDAATGMVVTTAPSGTRLFLTGQNLVQEGTTYIVTVGGERANVLRGTAELIEFRAPPVPAGKPNVLIEYWLVNNNWLEKGRLPFEVKAAEPIPPEPEPPVPGATNPRIDTITPSGDRVVIAGAGFGNVLGRVMLGKVPMPVVSWTDGRIECQGGPLGPITDVVVDLWQPVAGWYTTAWKPLPQLRIANEQ